MADNIPPEMPHGMAAIWHAILANLEDAKALTAAALAGIVAWVWRVEKRLRSVASMERRVAELETKTAETETKLDAAVVMLGRIDERTAMMLDRMAGRQP